MKTTITKSVRQSAGKAMRIEGIPADTSPIAKLSFVKRRYDGRSKWHSVTDWLDVPLEEYGAGNITGYRVTAELMAWAKEHPNERGHALQSTLEAALAVMAQPCTHGDKAKRGAAASVVSSMMSLLGFAATNADHAKYCAGRIAEVQKYQAWRTEQDAIERAQFVERMKAARAAKRAAKAVAA